MMKIYIKVIYYVIMDTTIIKLMYMNLWRSTKHFT